MSSLSNLAPFAARQATLPPVIEKRMAQFHNDRVQSDWGGTHIMRGRQPAPGDLILQSNDYLSIAHHPRIIDAQIQALRADGNGPVMSSVFMHENDPLHLLESRLAKAFGYPEAMLAQSGYQANIGLLQAVADEDTPVYIDLLAHTSLWEGIRSAGATPIGLRHNDPEYLRRQLARHGPGIILVDAVYSTTGALCPLQDYAAIAYESDSVLVVDESHSLGTHGERGEGLVASLGLNQRVHFITASLAKAYAGRAGLVACPTGFRSYLSSTSYPQIFSSCLLPHELAAIDATHRLIRTENWRRDRLRQITFRVRNALTALGYPIGQGSQQIIALEVGEERDTMRVRDILEANGIFGAVFCAPATAKQRSLLRLSLNAGMSETDVERLLAVCRDQRAQLAPDQWSANKRRRHRLRQPSLEHVA